MLQLPGFGTSSAQPFIHNEEEAPYTTIPTRPSGQEALEMWGRQLGEDQKKLRALVYSFVKSYFCSHSLERHGILRELLLGVEDQSCSSVVRLIVLGASLIANICNIRY